MTLPIQIAMVIIGALLTGLNGCIVFILSDLRRWLKDVDTKVATHLTDRNLHTSCGRCEK